MNDSIRGRYKAEAVFDERRSTAGSEQERQKDTSGKSGHVKPVHPCTGLTTRGCPKTESLSAFSVRK